MTKPLREIILFLGFLGSILVLVNVGVFYLNQRLDFDEPKVGQIRELQEQAFDVLYMGNSFMHLAVNPAA